MDSSFTPIEQMLKFRASRHEDFPYQEILLTRLCMHMQHAHAKQAAGEPQ